MAVVTRRPWKEPPQGTPFHFCSCLVSSLCFKCDSPRVIIAGCSISAVRVHGVHVGRVRFPAARLFNHATMPWSLIGIMAATWKGVVEASDQIVVQYSYKF